MSMHDKSGFDSSTLFTGSVAERRAAVQRVDEERALARRQELDLQTSPINAPQERIRIWERLHALRLPTSATHPLVEVIAAQTELTLRDIKEEQQRRRLLNSPAPKAEEALPQPDSLVAAKPGSAPQTPSIV